MTKLSKTFGDQVKKHRAAAGMTQGQLADECGVSEEWVRRIERGEASPSFDTIQTLCDALDVCAAELFGGRPIKVADEAIFTSFMTRIGARKPEELAWIEQLLDLVERRPKR